MARFKDKEKALALRKQEMSYSQIKKILGISKSTLSNWLKDYPLSEKRIQELRDCDQKIEKCRETKKKKKEARLNLFYEEQKKIIFPLLNKQGFYLAGIFLYWGEGSKTHPTDISVSNTDPSIIKFFIFWLKKNFGTPKNKIGIHLHLYADMNIEQEINFWSKILNIPSNQFNKPYIKKTLSTKINHKGGFGHGTCNVRLGDARLTEKIHMAIKAISNKYLNARS